MDPLAKKVVARYLSAVRWDNAANGTYISLYWNKTLWQVEESDTPISGMRDLTQASNLDTYTMPTLIRDLAGKGENAFITIHQNTVRRYAHIKSEDKGPVVREKLIKAYGTLFDEVLKQWKEDGLEDNIRKLEGLLPTLRRKLVWKRS